MGIHKLCARCNQSFAVARGLCRPCYSALRNAGFIKPGDGYLRRTQGDEPRCNRGHLLTPDNIFVIKATGRKTCRICKYLRKKAYRAGLTTVLGVDESTIRAQHGGH